MGKGGSPQAASNWVTTGAGVWGEDSWTGLCLCEDCCAKDPRRIDIRRKLQLVEVPE